ncbi:MAG: PRD domain-containing protein [Clostridiales bacterium]|nr:PRD domain-containing protein [Clostridiales bacterium]
MRIEGADRFPELMSMSLPRFEMDFEQKLLLLLVLHKDFLIIQDIADRLLVSKSYAEKQLSLIIRKYSGDIQAQRHYGVRYVAPQLKRRDTFVKIMFPYLFGEDYGFALRQFHQLHFPILDYFSEDQILYARRASRRILEMKWFRITDESVQIVFLYILFLIHSNDVGYREELGSAEYFEKDFTPVNEFEGFYEWLQSIMFEWRLSESETDIQYFYKMLLSLQKQEIFYQEQVLAKMSSPVEAILRGIRERIGVDLCQDVELIHGLAGHLFTTVFREKYLKPGFGLITMASLKRQYPLGFDMAVVAVDYMRDMYQFSMTNADIISLALHFQAAVERLKGKKGNPRIIVICHLGKAAGSIICSKLERKIGDIEVLGSYSLQEFKKGVVPECDCVVTTERIIQTKLPVIYISLALPESEIKKVAENVRKIQNYHSLEQITL